MEVVFDKRKIMKQMKNGKSIDEINQETGISKRKLNRWKREIKIKTRIKELMDSGNYDEAKELVENLEGSENEITRIVYLTLIARREGNRDEEKRLSERQLELEPDNVIAMSVLLRIEKEEEDEAIKRGDMSGAYIALIRQKELAERRLTIEPENARTMSTLVNIAKREEEIARENGDTSGANAALARQKELLEKQLTINPNNLIAISILIRIAREEGDLAREEELLERRLTIEPVSGKTLSGLIRVAKERGNIIKAKKLLEKLLQLDPENLIAKRELELFTRWAGSKILPTDIENEIEEKILNDSKEKEETPISHARKLIYKSEDIVKAAEEIQRLLIGENETDRTLVLAELYYHTGLIDRANKQLRAYKRTLDSNMQSEDIKAINQAMQIMQSKRQVGFEWNEFWDKREGSKTSENSDITLETQMQIPTSDEER